MLILFQKNNTMIVVNQEKVFPVLSMITTAQYKVTKTLENLLKLLIKHSLECKGSFSFLNKISE